MLKKCPQLVLFSVLSLIPFSHAQDNDPDYAAKVKEWTTKPEFMSPLVDHLPKSSTVPSPKDVLGYYIGEPEEAHVLRRRPALLPHPRRKIPARQSHRHRQDRRGPRVHHRLRRLRRLHQESRHQHAKTSPASPIRAASPTSRPHEIIAQTKPIYTLSGGLHSAELGPPEMLMELAYRLATEDSPLIKKIRDEVVVAIMPVADPDGRDRNIDWYNRYLIDVTDDNAVFEGGRSLLGQVHQARRQSRHQLRRPRQPEPPQVVPRLASAHHARPARVRLVPLHLQRPGPAEHPLRSHPLGRAPLVLQLRDGAAHQVRHARRLDPRATSTAGPPATSPSCPPTTTA